MTSRDDAALLHRYVAEVRCASAAAAAALALYTMGGIGDLASDFRRWLIGRSDDSLGDIESTAPLLLWKCATRLADINAVRCLLEFGARESFREFREKITLLELPVPFPACLSWGRYEQVDAFLTIVGTKPSLRDIQLCRNYIDDDRVYRLVSEIAKDGSVPASSALFFEAGPVSWDCFATMNPRDETELLLVHNLAVENIRRGQPFREFVEVSKTAQFLQPLADELRRSGPDEMACS